MFVLPGFSEFIEKYFEVARDLQSRAFAVVVLDWPGQGRSERQLKQHPERAHIRHYAEHVDALRLAVAAIGREAPKPHLILAHSMGGCIALEAIARKRVEVAGAAFSAPMWGISIFFALRWLVRVLRLIGLGAMPLRGGVAIETFETNVVTNDRGRWQMQQDLFRADPRLKLGSPTVGWVVSSLRAIRGLFEHGLGPAERLPMLVALADDERVVNKSKEKALARRLREASVFTVDGAKHEILMETDARRAEFWKEFDRFCTRLKV
ncbi:MAG: alpha/beta hydrolase [Hyphomonadaceae bacterium]